MEFSFKSEPALMLSSVSGRSVSLQLPRAQLSIAKTSSTAADITAPSLGSLIGQKKKEKRNGRLDRSPRLYRENHSTWSGRPAAGL